MQTSISKYFGGKTNKASTATPTKIEIVNLCDDEISLSQDETTGTSQSIEMNFELNSVKHIQFATAIKKAFDQERSGDMHKSSLHITPFKYTPLEQQVVDIRKQHPDSLLIVECGYRMRFFGEDAVVAAKVLSIYAHMDHNFMVASIPTFRAVVHCRRLVAAGYKVAVVRQTETAALRKAGKSLTKGEAKKTAAVTTNTFSRAVAGVFSPGTNVEEFDPAFRELVQTSGSSSSNDLGEEEEDREDVESIDDDRDDGVDGVDSANFNSSAPAGDDTPTEVWITAIYEELTSKDSSHSDEVNNRVLAMASVDVHAHRVQCARFAGALAEQDFAEYIDLLKPTEVIYSDNISDRIVRMLSGLRVNSAAGPTALSVDSTSSSHFLKRLAPLPVIDFLTSSLADGGTANAGTAWVGERLAPECRSAVFALAGYLKTMNLEQALWNPAVDIIMKRNPEKESTEAVASTSADPSLSMAAAESFKLDAVTARDLEVFQCITGVNVLENNAHGGALENKLKKGKQTGFVAGESRPMSLFDVVNHCKSTYGRRTLRQWLLHPLCSVKSIRARQAAVRWLAACTQSANKSSTSAGFAWTHNVLGIFTSFADLESLLTSLQHARIFPRRLSRLLSCAAAVAAAVNPSQTCYAGGVVDLPPIIKLSLDRVNFSVISSNAEAFASKLSTEAVTVDAVTDIFRSEAERDFHSLCAFRAELASTEAKLSSELVNIRVLLKMPGLDYKSLRTGPVSSIEHLIEVPVAMANRIPADWIRSNCTKQMERFHSPKVLALQDRLYQLRDEIKRAAREAWTQYVVQVRDALYEPLRGVLDALGEIDALLSLSKLCGIPGYVEPMYCDNGEHSSEIKIAEGRHPMVEKYLERKGDQFISNDVHLRCNFEARSCQIVTGPNMGGKSSYVRMIALICLMGQIGAHVPAESAQLCLFDRIFTRMGAGDDLAAGQSTFMSELHRTNHILQRATRRSLVVLDELGRGTATNDGLAIAQATLTYLLRSVGCATLFVTHFPQIADLAERSTGNERNTVSNCPADAKILSFPIGRAINIHMNYMENTSSANDIPEVMFLYRAVEGPSRGSYGLNVARLAGIPEDVLALAAKNAAWMRSRRAATIAASDTTLVCDAASSRKRKADELSELNARKLL